MPTGNITDPLSLNYYAYCSNNPIFYQDPSGHWVETALDVVSLIESTASLAADPSIQNALFFAWDVASVALPFIPGSYLAKGVKWISKTDDVIDTVKAIDNTVDFADNIHDTKNIAGNTKDVLYNSNKIIEDKYDIYSSYLDNIIIANKGHTGRITPNNINEQFAMKQVLSNPLDGATIIKINLTDQRWLSSDGWVKMSNNVKLSNGENIEIHFVYNESLGVFDDFKFKN